MHALDLNLASRPFKNNTLVWIGFGLSVVVLAVLTTRNVQLWREHRALVADLRTDYEQVQGELDQLDRRERQALREIQKHNIGQLRLKAAKANDVIRWKSFSWTSLFNQLQFVQPWDVQMSSIHPLFRPEGGRRDERQRSEGVGVPVSVEGMAKSLEAFLEFERALFRDPHFNRVEPQGVDTDPATKEVVFRLRFFYDPVGQPAPAEVAEGTEPAEDEQPVDEARTGDGAQAVDEAQAPDGAQPAEAGATVGEPEAVAEPQVLPGAGGGA